MGTNSLARLDSWLIDHVAQPVVDWCAHTWGIGRKSLAVQTMLVAAVMQMAVVVALWQEGRSTAMMFAGVDEIGMGATLWLAVRMPDHPSRAAPAARLTGRVWRLSLLVMWIASDLTIYGGVAVGAYPAHRLVDILGDAWFAAMVAYLYVLACRTTPPEVRRRVPAGATPQGAA